MTTVNAKTIQIYLPTGEPRGLRIAELTTRIIQAVLVPRSDLAQAKVRPELDQVAMYFLFGEAEEQAKPIVYIGQTEDVRKRLDWHNVNKEFWKTAILIISRVGTFTQAHIRWLEWYGLQKAKEVARYTINNDQYPSKPFVTEPMEADLHDAFDTLSVLVAALGYPVFEPVTSPNASELFFLKAKDTDGTGQLVEDGFLVRAGSLGRVEIVPSAVDTVTALRSKLFESGVIAKEDGRIRFTEDYAFNTPSGAAVTLLGRTANGWVEWKNSQGLTLHQVKRADAEGA